MCMCVCLTICMCTMYILCLNRPANLLRLEIQVVVIHYGDDGTQIKDVCKISKYSQQQSHLSILKTQPLTIALLCARVCFEMRYEMSLYT